MAYRGGEDIMTASECLRKKRFQTKKQEGTNTNSYHKSMIYGDPLTGLADLA